MKKFSSISNYNVPEEPKVQVNPKEQDKQNLKGKLITLMNDLLKIQSVGAARTELINTAITISGKEMLADAIIDLLLNESSSEKVKLLESLKLEMNDWLFIDNKIKQVNSQTIQEKNSKINNIEKKLLTFIELYGDEKDFELHTEMLASRLDKRKDIQERIEIAQSLISSNRFSKKQNTQIKLLVEKFKERVNRIYS